MYVLGRLHEVGWISDEEYRAAAEEPLVYKTLQPDSGEEGDWYLEEVRRRLITLFSEENAARLGLNLPLYGEDAVYELGFTVRTAMEPKLQRDADKALKQGLNCLIAGLAGGDRWKKFPPENSKNILPRKPSPRPSGRRRVEQGHCDRRD